MSAALKGEPALHLQVAGLRKRYAKQSALDGVDLEVRRGELLAVLGPSGCGKSTLLKVIAGLVEADGGCVVLNGRRLDATPACERGIGFLFQNYALFPHLTVEENVAFGLMLRRVPAAARRQRAMELLELVGLASHARKLPRQLSGGEQQRVALARALATEPELLLLDEPLSALDAQIRHHLRKELAVIQKRLGLTTLLVTHDQEEAFELGDRIAVLRAGRVEQLGTPQELYEQPNSEFVARFVGQVNVLAGVVRDNTVYAGPWPLTLEGVDGPTEGTSDASCRLLFRPEDVELLGPPEILSALAETGAAVPLNLLRGKVVTALYLGRQLRITLVAEDGQLFTADLDKARAAELGVKPGAEFIAHLRQLRELPVDSAEPASLA